MFQLMHGDCLELMKEIPNGSVDLVLTDPPYGTVKGISNVDHGMAGKTEWDDALDPESVFEECNRILRMNGALILFSQEPYTSRLITCAHGNIPFSYRMVWLKDHFANALVAKKAPVSYYEDIIVFFKQYDTLSQHPLREYAKNVLRHCSGSLKGINAKLGHRRAEHFFYVESTQFGLCTKETYDELCSQYKINEQPWFLGYDQLCEIDRAFNRAFNRVFNLPEGKKYKSNVLSYKKDYGGLHPTQKPVALIEDLILTYSNENNLVVDFTMGSGTTGVACANTDRRFIGIEKDDNYFEIAKNRIEQAYSKIEQDLFAA